MTTEIHISQTEFTDERRKAESFLARIYKMKPSEIRTQKAIDLAYNKCSKECIRAGASVLSIGGRRMNIQFF